MTRLDGTAFEDSYRELCGALDSVRELTGARSALLADAGGRLVLQAGEVPGADPDRFAADCVESLVAERPLAGLPVAVRGAALQISDPLGGAYVLRLDRGMHLALALAPDTPAGSVWIRCPAATGPLEKLLERLVDSVAVAGGEEPREIFRRELNLRIDELFSGGEAR